MKQTSERKTDRRTLYTRQQIKDSIFQLLKKKTFSKITVTEVCRLAEINRGTFYLHYLDMEDVLDDILSDILCNTSTVFDHVFCPQRAACTYPFCDKIQNNKKYQLLFLDDSISGRLMDKLADCYKEGYTTYLMSHSLLTFQEAEAIFYFQMNGCLTVNKIMIRNKCTDWRKIQQVVDGFIRAGLETYMIKDQRP